MQKIRWVPSAGALDHFFDDELVPASRGVQPEMLRKIEPFPTTKELVPYNAGFLSGWVVERYQIDLVAAAKNLARPDGRGRCMRLCAAQVPGDTHRNLQVEDDYSGQTFKHILVPIWLLTYNYGTQNYQVVINGYTGAHRGQISQELGENSLRRAGRLGRRRCHRLAGTSSLTIHLGRTCGCACHQAWKLACVKIQIAV